MKSSPQSKGKLSLFGSLGSPGRSRAREEDPLQETQEGLQKYIAWLHSTYPTVFHSLLINDWILLIPVSIFEQVVMSEEALMKNELGL
jgi:hypothetical protein